MVRRQTYTICQDTRHCGGDRAKDIENAISLSYIESSVPGAQQINAAGKETGLENTEKDTRSRKLFPIVDKAHTNHETTPKKCNDGQMESGANFSDDDGRGRLKHDVCGEEDKGGDGLSGG